MDLNNRWTGKDTSKPRALGLLGHSVHGFNSKDAKEPQLQFILGKGFSEALWKWAHNLFENFLWENISIKDQRYKLP